MENLMVTLNEKIVKSAEIKDRIYYIWDNKIIGFGFKVIPNGKKKYAFRYLAPYGGRNAKQRWYLFGNNNVPSCSEARRIAIDLAKAVLKLRLLEIDCFENKPNLRAKWQAETYGLTETEVLYRGEQSASVLKKLWQSNRDFFLCEAQRKRCLSPLSWHTFYYPQ